MPSSLLPIAVLAMAAWTIAFVAVMVATRAAQAAASGNAAEPSPAIVALLCANDCKAGDPAVTATFLDLIARGFIKRSVTASGRVEIAPVDIDRSALTPYELQLLDHVTARARIGGGT